MNLFTWVLLIAAVLALLYLVFLAFVYASIQAEASCQTCKTDVHLERASRPGMVKQYAGFLPLKRYRCRRCLKTFYVKRGTTVDLRPDSLDPEKA